MRRFGTWAWAVASFAVAAISIGTMLSHGWVPIDEGVIALSARMVRAGFLPHLDFAYPYTGALPFWNAQAIKIAGDSMLSPRYALFGAFLCWLPAVWVLARRFVTPSHAAAAVVLAAWWSLLIYPAAMPTWYVLFLTTWALVALARWNDTSGRAWLALAGTLAGTAIVVKQTGILTLIGAGFGVLAIHQDRELKLAARSDTPRRADPTVLSLLAIAMLAPVALVMRRGVLAGEGMMIALPLAATIGALAARERGLHANVVESRRALFGAWTTVTASALVAPALLVVFYASRGGVQALVDGVFGGALRTAATINQPMAPALTIFAFAIPLALVTAIAVRAPAATWPVDAAIAFSVAVGSALAAMEFTTAYLGVWRFATIVLPVAVLLASRSSLRPGRAAPGHGFVLAIAAATSLLAFNQVPYAAPNYFGYVAPLAFLLGLIVAVRAGLEQRVMVPAAILLIFGGWFNRIGNVATAGVGPIWWDDAHRLPGAHGQLLVTAADSAQQARIVSLIAEHSGPDDFAAGPELPQLYVLAGTRRLVAQPYLLSPDPAADSSTMAAAIDTAKVRLIAINDAPLFLQAVSPGARAWLAARYPHTERVGDVDVRWR